MADSYTVATTEDPAPTLEEQAAEIDVKETEAAQEAAQPQTYSEERPEWLPEKFENAEAMAKAYSELETKLGQPEQSEAEEALESADPSTIEEAAYEFSETGELSEDTYKALEGQGLNKTMVDAYIAGQQAIVAQQQMEITAEIGGMSEYKKLSDWASETLSDEDLEAYNETVESGTVAQAKFALKSLYGQYKAAGAPAIAQGFSKGTGVPPFQSRAQVQEAMKDRRYNTDPAYRQEVIKRLARSNV
jgi:hypothetical protein